MYVIFPADEVVYLSYGRLIYVPQSPSLNTQVNQQSSTTATTSVEESPQSSSVPIVRKNIPTIQESRSVVPQVNQISSLDRKKLKNKPDNIQQGINKSGNKSRQSPEVGSVTKFHKRGSDSSKSISPPSTISVLDELDNKANIRPRSVSESKQIEQSNKPPSLGGSLKVQKSIKEKNSKLSVKSKTFKPEDPYLGSVFCGDNKVKERNEIPRSEIINTRSDQCRSEKTDKVRIKRENSFIRRIFNGQFSNSRTVVNDKSAVDFDSLFKRDKSTEKISVSAPSTPSRFAEPVRDSTGVQRNTNTLSEKSSTKLRIPRKSGREGKLYDADIRMAASESPLKDLIHPDYNEHFKSHNAVTFKLVRIVSDFTQQLGQMYEQHAEELQNLVTSFRKRNSDLRKERPACPSSLFHSWETLLQDVEIDSQALSEIASILGRQVSRSLLEKSFYRKIQSRKIFTHRESYETIIAKTEEKLVKCRQEYKAAYVSYISNPSNENLSLYYKTHNAYVQQLHATNGMMEEYGKNTLPSLLQELEEVYSDLCSTVTDGIIQGAELVSNRAQDKYQRYESLVTLCRSVNGKSDLTHFVRSLPAPSGRGPILRKIFVPPQPPPPPEEDSQELQYKDTPPLLRDELVLDGLTSAQIKPSYDVLSKEAQDLEAQIRQIQEALTTLVRVQQRSLESNLFNKANEIQEDISMKRFDLKVSQIHQRAISSQKELFSNKLDGETAGRDRTVSLASQGSMKTKWLKAFKNLKTPPEVEKKNGSAATKELLKGDPDAHNFQENTYKKITPCDVCSQVLRGHTRQGLKCRICKMNVHFDCQEKAAKCQAKARLLRRQKSTSEIETRNLDIPIEDERITEVFSMPTINRRLSTRNDNRSPPILYNNGPVLEPGEVDKIYQVLKQATEISSNKPRIEIVEPGTAVAMTEGKQNVAYKTLSSRAIVATEPMLAASSTPCAPNSVNCVEQKRGPPLNNITDSTSMRRRIFAGMKNLTSFRSRSRHGSPGQRSISLPETPHSPRRQKLNLRMKSLSLDSPESSEHIQRRKHQGSSAASDPHSSQGSSSKLQSPSSPVHNRRLLSTKNIRMSSVELPNEQETKSPSSASASPCPSPVGNKKINRLLPTSLYVVLYNFKSRHQDELDLKAGYKVTVIDTSDPDWWKGKCLGRSGFFPSKYVTKLSPGEKPLQVTHNLQVSDGDNGLMLLRDQIVIQIGEEVDGMIMIRSADNRQGVCPVKFLQDV